MYVELAKRFVQVPLSLRNTILMADKINEVGMKCGVPAGGGGGDVKARVNDCLEMCCLNGYDRRELTTSQFMDLLYLTCKVQPKWLFLDSEYQMVGCII